MRTMYQKSPWHAVNGPVFRSYAFSQHAPQRLGDPSAFFSREQFIPTKPLGAPVEMGRALVLPDKRIMHMPEESSMGESVEGVDVTRPVCRCHFAGEGSQLGQACSKPTSGGSGSAEFGTGETGTSSGPNVGTIIAAGVVGVALLYAAGIL